MPARRRRRRTLFVRAYEIDRQSVELGAVRCEQLEQELEEKS
jgi:hypothetical protein